MNSERRNYGFKPSRRDPRDYIYSQHVGLTYGAPLNIPATYLPKRLPFVNDQGRFGTCGGESGSEVIAYHFGVRTAPLYAYTAAKQLEGNLDEGVQPVSIAQVVVNRGVCLETLCDYSQLQDVTQLPTLTAEMDADAATRKATSYAKVQTVDEIKHSIANGNPLLIAILVFDNFETSQGGFIPLPQGTILGGHLLCGDGYDDTLTHTYPDGHVETGFVRCLNSWGEGFGDGGYIYLPYSFFTYVSPDPDAPIHCFMEGWSVIAPNPVVPVEEDVIKVAFNNPTAIVNGENVALDAAPIMSNDHLMVPIRFIGESLGAQVSWDQTTQTATIRRERV